jgi:hypothetical protein
MMNKSRKIKFLSLMLAASGFVLAGGHFSQVSAQRDPFAKPAGSTPRIAGSGGGSKTGVPNAAGVRAPKPQPTIPVPVGAPNIQDRIAYYKQMREAAANSNQPIPKVTSVLTLDEMSVVGIFRTPRGYAAMVEAKPIKLSYTIYPGEKFFDAQLVAIEENRLVFRKVTKMSNGKFIAAEENKALRQYTVDQQVQGTAPVEPSGKTETAANNDTPQINPPAAESVPKKQVVVSPLDEMNKQPADSASKESAKSKLSDSKNQKGKTGSSASKKVAKNKDQ